MDSRTIKKLSGLVKARIESHIICYVISTSALLVAYYLTEYNFFVSVIAILLSIFMLSMGTLSWIDKNKLDIVKIACMTLIYLMMYLFFSLLLIKSHNPNLIVGYSTIFLLGMPLIACIIRIIRYFRGKGKELIDNIKYFISENRCILILNLIFILFSVETIDATTILDADVYFNAFSKIFDFDFTFSTLDSLKLGGHLCFGYDLIYGIGYLINPTNASLLRVTSIMLVSISSFCIYRLILNNSEKISKKVATLCTGIYLLNPLVLGMIYDINLDLPCCVFFIFLLYAVTFNNTLLIIFFIFLLVFSKETGIILLLGLFAELFIRKVFIEKNNRGYLSLILMAMAAILWYFSFWVTGKFWRQSVIQEEISSNRGVRMSSFCFSTDNALMKIKEMFFANFSWIIWTAVIVLFMLCISNAKKIRIPFIGALLTFGVFQFVYLTYVHMRYITPWIIFEALLIGSFICAIESERIQSVLIGAICVCLFMESFMTVDPVTKKIFNNIEVGKQTIISTRTFIRGGG